MTRSSLGKEEVKQRLAVGEGKGRNHLGGSVLTVPKMRGIILRLGESGWLGLFPSRGKRREGSPGGQGTRSQSPQVCSALMGACFLGTAVHP